MFLFFALFIFTVVYYLFYFIFVSLGWHFIEKLVMPAHGWHSHIYTIYIYMRVNYCACVGWFNDIDKKKKYDKLCHFSVI